VIDQVQQDRGNAGRLALYRARPAHRARHAARRRRQPQRRRDGSCRANPGGAGGGRRGRQDSPPSLRATRR
jgi:hypothetical protein